MPRATGFVLAAALVWAPQTSAQFADGSPSGTDAPHDARAASGWIVTAAKPDDGKPHPPVTGGTFPWAAEGNRMKCLYSRPADKTGTLNAIFGDCIAQWASSGR